ncbi:hypothetical protein BG000_004684, partial [Podila horticola]
MTLSDHETQSISLVSHQASPAEHVTQPTETGAGHEADDMEEDPDSIWHCLCTVEEEDFLREVHRSLHGLESVTLERWIHRNELKYPRKDSEHWRQLAKADGRYRDELRDEIEGGRLPERFLRAYRARVLADLEENEDGSPVEKKPEAAITAPGAGSVGEPEGDSTRVYSPDVSVGQPAAVEANRPMSPADARAEPVRSQEPNQRGAPVAHGVLGAESNAQWRGTIRLLQREYELTLNQMEWLDKESQQPHPVEYAGQLLREWHALRNRLTGLLDQLKWFSMFEAGPFHMYSLVAMSMVPGLPGNGHGMAWGLGLSAQPSAVPGMNFTGFGAHPGYQFGAPAS